MRPCRLKLFQEIKQNKNIFVETGTYKGEGVQAALSAGYSKIITFEIDSEVLEETKNKFKDSDKIEFILGSSAEQCFKDVIDTLKEPVIFWLDAHRMHKGFVENPLYTELDVISQSKLPHVILIDDVRLFPTKNFKISFDGIEKILNKYNRKYTTEFGTIRDIYPDDVFVIKFNDC